MTSSQASFPLPFNQNQVEGSNGAVSHQVMLTNPSILNSSNPFPCSPCSHNNPSINSQFRHPVSQFAVPVDNSFGQLSNLNGNATAFPNPHFVNASNHHFPMKNSHMHTPPLVSSTPQDLRKPHGQFYSQNALQNMNPFAASQQHGLFHNLPQNFNQTIPSFPHGQLFMQNCPQVTNQARPLQAHAGENMPGGQCVARSQSINQFIGVPYGQFPQQPIFPQVGAFNMSHSSVGCLHYPNPPFPMNPQSSMVNSNQFVQQNMQNQQLFIPWAIGQNTLEDLPVADQNSQKNAPPSLNSGSFQKQETENQCPQVNQDENNSCIVSNFNHRNHQSKYSKNHQGYEKKKSAHPRFQKSKPHHMANAKGTFNPSGGKGHYNDRVGKSQLENSVKKTKVEDRRSVPLNYSEKEIQQWRHDRKKNYPTKSNIEKKLTQQKTQPEVVASDAQKRRQQLKEILTKQAELGIEVAELPPNYLSDSNDQVCKNEGENRACSKNNRFQNKRGRFQQNKYGKRRKHGKGNRFVKNQRFGEDAQFSQHNTLSKKEPTLLEKLLSADIKRDKIHLLQVFRFMTTNTFFKHWPKKPLEFPMATVKEDAGSQAENIEEKPFRCLESGGISEIGDNAMVKIFEDSKDHDVTSDEDENENNAEIEEMVHGHVDEIDYNKDEMDDSEEDEEGEITD